MNKEHIEFDYVDHGFDILIDNKYCQVCYLHGLIPGSKPFPSHVHWYKHTQN